MNSCFGKTTEQPKLAPILLEPEQEQVPFFIIINAINTKQQRPYLVSKLMKIKDPL